MLSTTTLVHSSTIAPCELAVPANRTRLQLALSTRTLRHSEGASFFSDLRRMFTIELTRRIQEENFPVESLSPSAIYPPGVCVDRIAKAKKEV